MSNSLQNKLNHKNDEFVHFQKINIFGDSGVGKSSLIEYFENFNNSEYNLNNKIERTKTNESFEAPFLVEQLKRKIIDFNEDRNLYFNIFESNLDDYDNIKTNLDTLLIQTECIIIMWDSHNPESFDNIPNFVSTIEAGISEYKFRDVPIFVIQNKIDLDNKDENSENEFKKSIEDFKLEHPNIIYVKISLFDKDAFYDLLGKIYQKMQILEKDLNIAESKIRKEDDIINNVKFNRELKDLNMQKNNEIIDIIKCSILGDSTVGKTTFINFLLGKQAMGTLPTIGVGQTAFAAEVFKEKVYFQLIDTAGQERYNYSNIPLSQYKNADGILLFFDVTNKSSFQKINVWIENIIKNIGEINNRFALFLIGNKIDLNEKREVSKKDAKELADNYKIKYFECSSLKGINCYELFNEITLMAYKKNKSKGNAQTSILRKEKHKKRNKKKNVC